MDCLFCKIGNKEIPSEIIYEDDGAFAILDIHPIALGHSMVMPKKHAETILDLGEGELAPLFSAVRNVTKLLQKVLAPDGFTIGINQGKASGQTIEHFHIHIIPRFQNDGGGSIHSVVDNQPKETIREIAERIKKIKN
ncbi:MAG: HIT family protein [Candidatus Liptonbacteria bacterium]|nr:HIT family protein [Candidatus Liptonbacteria bacterium]